MVGQVATEGGTCANGGRSSCNKMVLVRHDSLLVLPANVQSLLTFLTFCYTLRVKT